MIIEYVETTEYDNLTQITYDSKAGKVRLLIFKDRVGYAIDWDSSPEKTFVSGIGIVRHPLDIKINRKLSKIYCDYTGSDDRQNSGIRMAQMLFSNSTDCGWSSRKCSAIARRAIALMQATSLPTQAEAAEQSKILSTANNFPVNVPSQGWIEALESYVQ